MFATSGTRKPWGTTGPWRSTTCRRSRRLSRPAAHDFVRGTICMPRGTICAVPRAAPPLSGCGRRLVAWLVGWCACAPAAAQAAFYRGLELVTFQLRAQLKSGELKFSEPRSSRGPAASDRPAGQPGE